MDLSPVLILIVQVGMTFLGVISQSGFRLIT